MTRDIIQDFNYKALLFVPYLQSSSIPSKMIAKKS